jgi:PAS domain S-box-containing protein
MGESISVLHVDDEPSFADMVATFLKREDDRFTVENATRASVGVDQLLENGFDCVVSDYDMPGQNGIEFLENVREMYPDLPFLLFTGKGSEEVASEAITAGATDYIQKGTGTEQYRLLANRIQNLVEKYWSQAAVQRSEERYHNLVDTAPIPILLFDTGGELVYANDAAVSFLDADSQTDIEDEPFTAFLHPEDQTTAQERFQRLMSEETPAPEIEYRVRTVDGELKHATVATAYGYYKGEKVAQAMIHH